MYNGKYNLYRLKLLNGHLNFFTKFLLLVKLFQPSQSLSQTLFFFLAIWYLTFVPNIFFSSCPGSIPLNGCFSNLCSWIYSCSLHRLVNNFPYPCLPDIFCVLKYLVTIVIIVLKIALISGPSQKTSNF